MALEKQMKTGKRGEMTPKQKAMIGAIIVVGLIMGWQIIGLFSGDSGAGVSPAKPVANGSAKMTAGSSPPGGAANIQMAAASQLPLQSGLKQMPVMTDARFLQLQQASEEKYIDKLNDLENLKIQRQIAETNQAIATAKLATVAAEKNISDLLTKPTVPTVPVAAYANGLVTPAMQGGGQAGSQSAEIIPDYTVISVMMQRQKWNAVMGYQGKLLNVSIGDVLPADGSVVEAISKNGVILKKDGKSKTVNMMSAI
jgi:hypothetical protein